MINVRSTHVPTLAGLFGLATFMASLGLGIVDPTRIDWVMQGDSLIHFLGWHMFRRGPWNVPLGDVPLWTWPVGTSVGLTDSIPAIAILLKPLSPFLPRDFQYLGAWLLSCFVLQGVFGALLMRLATPDRILQLLGAMLMVMSPPMIIRQGHAALTAHWMVLAALWLYLSQNGPLPSTRWVFLAGLAAGTHPYLALMVLSVAAAAHGRALIGKLSEWRTVIGRFALTVGVTTIVFWQSGYFVVGRTNGLQAGGFGLYSMNLLALVQPLGYTRAPRGPLDVATAGQYEGYAYLGAGLLLIGIAAIVIALSRPRILTDWRPMPHLPFIIALSVLALLALSPRITAGPWTLLQYDERWWGPLAVFRASGRLFWPVYYTIVLGMLALVCRLGGKRARLLVCAAAVVQAVDVSGTYAVLQSVRTYTYKNPLQSHFWDVVPRHYRTFYLFPTSMCTPAEFVAQDPFSLLAGRYGMAINAGAPARASSQELERFCRVSEFEIATGLVSKNVLYILRADLTRHFQAAAQTPLVCVSLDGYGVCAAQETYALWQDDVDVMFLVLPSLAEMVRFYDELDREYASNLHRPAISLKASTEERVTALMRYLWYGLGGCDRTAAQAKLLHPPPGDVRICGDPFRGRSLPTIEDTFATRMALESGYARRPSDPTWTTHVDPEGEAAWVHRYVSERLLGRDEYGARVAVLNAIRAAAPR